MKRLFKLKHADGTVVYYDNKELCKEARNRYNDRVSEKKQISIQRGPDHWKGET